MNRQVVADTWSFFKLHFPLLVLAQSPKVLLQNKKSTIRIKRLACIYPVPRHGFPWAKNVQKKALASVYFLHLTSTWTSEASLSFLPSLAVKYFGILNFFERGMDP
jgi:hypothetical protein